MFSKELQILDENTVQYMIDEMKEEINGMKGILKEKQNAIDKHQGTIEKQQNTIDEQQNTIDEQLETIVKLDKAMYEKDILIMQLQEQLNSLRN